MLSRFRTDDRGATALEYGLIIALVFLVALAGITALANAGTGTFNAASVAPALVPDGAQESGGVFAFAALNCGTANDVEPLVVPAGEWHERRKPGDLGEPAGTDDRVLPHHRPLRLTERLGLLDHPPGRWPEPQLRLGGVGALT